MSRLVLRTTSENTAKGMVSGSDSMIVTGCRKLSNCPASTMYMNTTLRMKAMAKLFPCSASSLARPMNSQR